MRSCAWSVHDGQFFAAAVKSEQGRAPQEVRFLSGDSPKAKMQSIQEAEEVASDRRRSQRVFPSGGRGRSRSSSREFSVNGEGLFKAYAEGMSSINAEHPLAKVQGSSDPLLLQKPGTRRRNYAPGCALDLFEYYDHLEATSVNAESSKSSMEASASPATSPVTAVSPRRSFTGIWEKLSFAGSPKRDSSTHSGTSPASTPGNSLRGGSVFAELAAWENTSTGGGNSP